MFIRKMCRQFQLPVKILAHETVRDADGLALSSRNVFLQPAERAEAPQLYATLQSVQADILAGSTDIQTLEGQAVEALNSRGGNGDYVSLRRKRDVLAPRMEGVRAGNIVVIFASSKTGGTLLI